MPKRGLTEIVCVLDRSGSMDSIIDDAIGGFNAFLKTQQEVKDSEANMSIVLFDDEYSLMCVSLPLDKVKPFDTKTYVPRGSTALLDAIGRAVTDIQEVIDNTEEDEKPERVIVVILTDGGENASKNWCLKKKDNGDTRPSVYDLIKTKKQEGWEFLFLAANQDAMLEGGNYGIDASNTRSFAANSLGTQSAYAAMDKSVSTYRGGGSAAIDQEDNK